MRDCFLCNEPVDDPIVVPMIGVEVEDGEVRTLVGGFGFDGAHQECILRSVLGGIGHHENHDYWCREVGDPDGGRTYRQSAIEVEALFRKRSVARYN